ncbi:MAG: oligosaccharide flippase family protein [Microthrixaceae bacterium]|nr:oligosaccharide flippase family protein [Microthrixaceae bacterium]MCB9387062.1 oligosaccharide flippase family protein [Microthrixaceae bacterium]MCO5321595.1 oligosaccharide flippase family protein [Microthrixaceae bacterium]
MDPEEQESPGQRVSREDLGTAATRGYLWANVGLLSRFGVAFVLASVLARSLSKSDYDAMVALTVVMLYADTTLDLGMGASLIYEQETGRSRRVNVAFTANVALALVLAVAAVGLAPVLGAVFNLADYVGVFMIMGPIIVISGLNTVPWALLNRDLSFRPRAVSELLRDGTRLVLTLILVLHYDLGIWGVVWGFVASRTVWTVVTWIATRYKPILAWERSIVKELFAYAWRMAGNRFLGLLALNGDYFVVGNRTSSLDLYYQAFRLPEIVMGGQLNAMSAVLFPMYSRIRTEGPDALRSAMYRALRIVGLFSIPVGIGLALVARDVITVMFGTGDSAAVPTMELISLTGCVTGLGFATGDLLYAINRPGLLMRINLVMVPTMLATMWFVAPHGIEWVAFTHLCIQAVFVTIRQVVVNGLVGASMMKVVLSCGPGMVVATGVLVFALPVRLLTDAGALSGLLVTLAGAVGAALALAVSPPARTELMELVAKVRGN